MMSAARIVDWLFRDRSSGRIVIAQFPNPPLWIFAGASLAKRFWDPGGTAGTVLAVVAVGSLLWWAADELARGVNPFRRILGAAVLVVTVAGVVLRL